MRKLDANERIYFIEDVSIETIDNDKNQVIFSTKDGVEIPAISFRSAAMKSLSDPLVQSVRIGLWVITSGSGDVRQGYANVWDMERTSGREAVERFGITFTEQNIRKFNLCNIYIAEVSYENRNLAKSAGFRWQAVQKIWATFDKSIADASDGFNVRVEKRFA